MGDQTRSAVSLRSEKRLLRSGATVVCGVDEVGRGALSGPVTVGMVLIDGTVRGPLAGVRDSKLLAPQARVALVPRIRSWAVGYAVGHASAAEIDDVGIIEALRRAGRRALAALPRQPDAILLDGSHDWLTTPGQASLFEACDDPIAPVTTQVKADLTCASVAAASILAKTERDALMVAMSSESIAYEEYAWHENKGYASPAHMAALRRLGPCDQHRRTWRLPTVSDMEPLGEFRD